MKLFSDLEELASAGVAKSALLEVDDWSGERVPARARESLQRLSFFYEEFYATLDARGMSTRASRLRAAAAGLRAELFPGVDRLIFAGFFALAGAEADLLRSALTRPRAELLLLAGKGVASVLDVLGIDDPGLRARTLEAELEPPPPVEFVRSADTHGQIFALNATLAAAREDGEPLDESRAVVLPAAETLFPLYQQTLAALDPEGYNISLGYPLVRTPVYGFFLRLLELVRTADETGRVYMPDYLRFVLHPYAKNLYFPGPERRTDFTRILFHAVEEAAAERRTRSFRDPRGHRDGRDHTPGDPGNDTKPGRRAAARRVRGTSRRRASRLDRPALRDPRRGRFRGQARRDPATCLRAQHGASPRLLPPLRRGLPPPLRGARAIASRAGVLLGPGGLPPSFPQGRRGRHSAVLRDSAPGPPGRRLLGGARLAVRRRVRVGRQRGRRARLSSGPTPCFRRRRA